MKPVQVSAALRRIASKIEYSKSPNKSAVISDLKMVLASLGRTASSLALENWYWHPEWNQLTLVFSGTFNDQPIAPDGEEYLIFNLGDPMNVPLEPTFDSGIPDCLSTNGKFNPNSACWGEISTIIDSKLPGIKDEIEEIEKGKISSK